MTDPNGVLIQGLGVRAVAGVFLAGLDEDVGGVLGAPRTPDELWNWVWGVLGVRIPRAACCVGHAAPFDAFATAYFGKTADGRDAPVVIVKGSRGLAGKSFLVAALSLTEAATLKAQVTTLGGSGEQSANIVQYVEQFVGAPAFPGDLLAPKVDVVEVEAILAKALEGRKVVRRAAKQFTTLTRVRLANGGQVIALTASTRSTRGPHPQRLRIDEADEVDGFVLDSALGQPMSKHGVAAQTLISSTHHYPDGTMTRILERAERNDWPVFEWCYRESLRTARNPDGWLDPADVDRTQKTVPASMWAVEYELQEPSIEGRAIQTDAVDAMFDERFGVFEGLPDQDIVVEEPRPGVQYLTGIDWAKDRDWTVIWTVRVLSRPKRVKGKPAGAWRFRTCAWKRTGRKPWSEIIADANDRTARYPGRVCHDATSAGGKILDEELVLYGDAVIGVDMVGKRRRDMLNDYVVAVESGAFQGHPRIDWSWRSHRYATIEDLYRSTGHLPDDIAAGALLLFAAGEAGPDAAVSRKATARRPAKAYQGKRPKATTRRRRSAYQADPPKRRGTA